MSESYRFRVNGRVQGVSFRQGSRQRALELGLSGWVANQPDGSVMGEVAGAAEPLALFRRWLEHGPPLAQVTQLNWQACAAAQDDAPAGFEIRRG